MITGYNTDVEYDGVVYHVQTEDKGLRTPLILSLVYVRGEILAAKRAPYDDLIAGGFDEKILVQRLERQHKLICAAVHAGRIEDLKRMSGHEATTHAPPVATPAAPPAPIPVETPVATASPPPVVAPPADELTPPEALPAETAPAPSQTEAPIISSGENLDLYAFDTPLAIFLIDEPEFVGGGNAELKILVMRANAGTRLPAANVKVAVKTLSTAFSPSKVEAITDEQGMATVSLKFPKFRSGRSAVLIQAELEGTRAEVRRVIVPGS